VTRRRRSLRTRPVLVAALVAASGACGGGGAAATDPGSGTAPELAANAPEAGKPLTADQANHLAGMLLRNYRAGGAEFRATVPYGPAATFVVDGAVDWRTHIGRATLETRFGDGRTAQRSELRFTTDAVYDGRVADWPADLEAAGLTGVRWVSRQPDPQRVPLDVVLELVLGLASDRTENPLLVRQDDTGYLGTKELDGETVEGYRYQQRTRYWLAVDGGELRRLEADLAVASGTTTIEFRLGPNEVDAPNPAEVVGIDQLPAPLRDRLTGGG